MGFGACVLQTALDLAKGNIYTNKQDVVAFLKRKGARSFKEEEAERQVIRASWIVQRSQEQGKLFYYNSVTKQSAWESPGAWVKKPTRHDKAWEEDRRRKGEEAAKVWRVYRDEESGMLRFFNTATQKKTAKRPKLFVIPEADNVTSSPCCGHFL